MARTRQKTDRDGEGVWLSGHLAEFRSALEEEIDAASHAAASSAVPLVNGRRVASIGASFQYAFMVASILQVPDGSPCDLRLPGGQTHEAVIISIEGLSVTLAVGSDLGQFVPKAALYSDLTQLLRKLIERVEERSETPNPAGDRLLGLQLPNGNPDAMVIDGLTPEQSDAVSSALGRDTTFIWGPPGTGKTRTIGWIGERCYRMGRSVLLVSHTNTAVDEAIESIDSALQLGLEDGSVIRVGEPRHQLRDELLASVHVRRRSSDLAAQEESLLKEIGGLKESFDELSRLIELAEWAVESKPDIEALTAELERVNGFDAEVALEGDNVDRVGDQAATWEKVRLVAETALALEREIARLQGALDRVENTHTALLAIVAERAAELEAAKDLLDRSLRAGFLLRQWRSLPDPKRQEASVAELQNAFRVASDDSVRVFSEIQKLRGSLARAITEYDASRAELGGAEPQQGREAAIGFLDDLERRRAGLESSRKRALERRRALDRTLRERVKSLRSSGFDGEPGHSAESRVAFLLEAHRSAEAVTQGRELTEMRAEADALARRLPQATSELEIVRNQMATVEETVIAEARIVATTLTRAYLRDAIQKRRFDLVILDEASMAPIPALWLVAALADSIVVVGDFLQLPPICISADKMAEKWLGRDIFDIAGISELLLQDNPPPWATTLREQRRMHPAIGAIPNQLVYNGILRDGPDVSDSELAEWFTEIEPSRSPVVLVDMEPLHAWVTSVPSGRGSSRLNFLSATVCTDLADAMLRPDRPPPTGPRYRILIATPYRPQARLTSLIVSEQGLGLDVAAGTAHQLQGNEASVVILDLVNDDPHWRVGMFVPDFDENTKRLLNVALTRARRRLVVVGDFDWVRRNTQPHCFIRKLLGYLEARFPKLDARQLVAGGLSARAAAARALASGGTVEPTYDRLVVTQEHFYPLLFHDLAFATSRIIVFSPFITMSRLSELQEHFQAAHDRGVKVWVVTKALDDRGKRETPAYQQMESALRFWGATVVHKSRMHEKLVFVDEAVLWSGSLNPLSFTDTQEIMERRASTTIVEDFAKTIRLKEMLDPYDAGETTCPICGCEVVLAEGRNEPYWRCVSADCYTRSIDRPPLRDGMIRCGNCDGQVEFGEWGGRPHWRCTVNRSHRQPIARSHLRLPKMRRRIPRADLADLERTL